MKKLITIALLLFSFVLFAQTNRFTEQFKDSDTLFRITSADTAFKSRLHARLKANMDLFIKSDSWKRYKKHYKIDSTLVEYYIIDVRKKRIIIHFKNKQ